MRDLPNLPQAALTEKAIGIFYRVYNDVEYGYSESVYESAMAIALSEEPFEVQRQPSIAVFYRGQQIGIFRPGFVIDGVLVLELKAVEQLRREHEPQLLNYLRASGAEVGLLLNFGPRPSFRRVVYTPRPSRRTLEIRDDPPDPPDPSDPPDPRQ